MMPMAFSLPASTSIAVATASVALCLGAIISRGCRLNRLLPSSSACRPVRVPSAETPPITALVSTAVSVSAGTPTATIAAADWLKMALQARVMAESAPNAATASLSRVSRVGTLDAARPNPGVKVSTMPMIEDEGSAMVRVPVSTSDTVMP